MKAKKRNTEVPDTIEVIIILPGVEIIPKWTFPHFRNAKIVIMADTVRRIVEEVAFCHCKSLSYVRLSRNLEYIGELAFNDCEALTSIFVPPSCREIGEYAFYECTKLIILHVPQHTQIGLEVISKTLLNKRAIQLQNQECKHG